MQENFNKGGEAIMAWIQPKCECGWVGKEHYAHNDYQHTNAHEELEKHVKTCVVEEPAQTDW